MRRRRRARSRPRPVIATFIGAIACVWGLVLVPLGAAVVAEAEGQSDEAGIGAGVGLLFLGAFAFAIAYGAFRIKRWAWVAFMTWAAVGLATNLLRVFFFPAEPHYETLAISALTVFLLTPLEVQVAFGVRTARLATLDTSSRNPIDGV